MCLLTMVNVAKAQLTVPSKVKPHEPIISGCECIVPKDGEAQFIWRVDDKSKFVVAKDGKKIYVWAAPGKHWIEATVIIQTYTEITVFVPDPAAPTDPTKAKLKKIKISTGHTIQRYTKQYVVEGKAPDIKPDVPPDDDDDDPQPDNLSAFAKLARKWMKDVPGPNYSRDFAMQISRNYATVAAQGSDPARSRGWTVATFTQKTKELNNKLDRVRLTAWATTFFRPLSKHQAALFQQRGLKTSDTKAIAKLWEETATAIKKAAESIK